MARLKQFKSESKRLLDLMINSIYTNQEIFLRELISNASDAIDKLFVQSLDNDSISFNKDDLKIEIKVNKELRMITIKDNGIGMSKESLEENLGTIAYSGSKAFKEALESDVSDVDIIGQFGVGFYSSFMVAKEVRVLSKASESDDAYVFISNGVDGYQINKVEKSDRGSEVVLFLKDSTEDNDYDQFLESYLIKSLVKKYSDYVRYPIVMVNEEGEEETLNSQIPLWKRSKQDITDEEYNQFYKEKFNDFEDPLKVIHMSVEGMISFNALLYIPKKVPFNFYSSEHEKGLQLYSRSILIEDKNKDLIPDHFRFVRGVVDSADLSLNISREVLQNNHQLKKIASRIEKKIKSELENMLANEREVYEEFFDNFGMDLKFGIYNGFGVNKDLLQDLIMFKSSHEDKYTTLAEYVERKKEDQKEIYYVSADSILKARQLPQSELVIDKGYELLFLTHEVDEFALKMLGSYNDLTFKSINQGSLDLDSSEEKEKLETLATENKSLLEKIQDNLKDKVDSVRLSSRLKSHPVCIVSGEGISFEMEKVVNQSPDENQHVKAERILEINPDHPILSALQNTEDEQTLSDYSQLLYDQALLIEGLPIENPSEFSLKIANLMVKASQVKQD
ncbi:MAG: molecular chaperone HtpG [Erysipelothrix sp.]|nr:molecular chaperone HtpG [Erysipelothrix sp.]